MSRTRYPYPSDLSNTEWALLEPLLASSERRGRPPKWSAWRIADAVFYLLRSGCAWRMLPRECPTAGRRSTTTSASGVGTDAYGKLMTGCARQCAKALDRQAEGGTAPVGYRLGGCGLHGTVPGVDAQRARVACGGAPASRPAVVAIRAGGEAAWFPSATTSMGDRKDFRLAGTGASASQGLRKVARDGGGYDLRGDEPAHAAQVGAARVKDPRPLSPS